MLERNGLVEPGAAAPGPVPSATIPASPEVALARLLEREERALAQRLEGLKDTRRELEALSNNLIRLRTGADSVPKLTLLEGEQNVLSALESAAACAREEILSMHPGAPLPMDMLTGSMQRNRQVLARGVAMRSIHLDAMLRVPHGRAHLTALQEAGIEVRVAAVLPFRLIVVDRMLGYASTGAPTGQFAALEFRGPDAVHFLVQTFDYCWIHGALTDPADDLTSKSPWSPSQPGEALGERERALLRMLSQGLKDDAIARSLGVSSRTLRRLMTDVMTQLSAESRFQAGAQAMAFGWLDT
ncbi:LuxR C-terminal-related transcriptional regulator [Streptacidiphilus sp. P02-A3a]|uniref:helix-turn-helix transcriptional regulator n=1 Tax=Streptacidiphilus sp. P02-A3a TaxID=2704468 RepID=UPI0015FE3E47|nr:LuxR C-terminal-related transcriptional regulator [Streptacidiphilus sp. P02-A3a]QMU71315.1 hypothetical protein GXP74_26880 [Streptacidiphilus sp. P02-A3a]